MCIRDRYNTANVNALLSLAWTEDELKAVSIQLKNLVGIPEYPGSYIVPVYVDNAFMDVYNNGTNAVSAMLDRILDINKEISRKRREFLSLIHISYGLPTVMAFHMMFYRVDTFAELGLEIPKTWEDLYTIMPVLQNKHMQIGLPTSLVGTNIFLYQLGGELYAQGGRRINLDSNVGLKAFELLTDMFRKDVYKRQV